MARSAAMIGLVCACLAGAWNGPARGAQVTRLAATHRDGQTFLTWRSPQLGTQWTYRVYAGTAPFLQSSDLVAPIAEVGDSSWYDRRLSTALGATYAFATDSGGPPLDATKALCVVTVAADRQTYYAVTAQLGSEPEDRSLSPGGNSILAPVHELVAAPRPVHQRTIVSGIHSVQVYTLWTTDHATPLFPAMGNREGLAFDCGVVRGGSPPNNSLMICPHHRQGNFMNVTAGSGYPGEWILALDDPYPELKNSFWYGYHEAYDLTSESNPVPASGVVRDYTLQRVVYTVMWARRNFPIDTTRVYAMGASMGSIGSVMLAFHRPDLLAAAYSVVGKFDFAFLNDPDASNGFNTGGGLRLDVDPMWGYVATNLPSSDGRHVFESLNDGYMAAVDRVRGVPPIIAFNGKHDTTVGWAEKIAFYAAMEANRLGGYWFWDMRDHVGTSAAAWEPMQQPQYVYRFRTNLSFPALSNCSANLDPGGGAAASGDSVGTINGFIEWNTAVVDEPAAWEVDLWLRNLPTLWGGLWAPDPLHVDVTPRRLQQFVITPAATFHYTVRHLDSDDLIASGDAVADGSGILTIPGVTVTGSGSRLRIEPAAGSPSGAQPARAVPAAPGNGAHARVKTP